MFLIKERSMVKKYHLLKIIPFLVMLLVFVYCFFNTFAGALDSTNPLIQKRADPHIYKHTDGSYYFTASVPEYDRIIIRKSNTIKDLATATENIIWKKHSSGEMGQHIWAPELHFINNKWYIYFAAGSTSNKWAIRMYVLENSSASPLTGNWVEKGEIQPKQAAFSLDATTFENNGVRYLVFAKQDSRVNNESCLFIASMSNPWTLNSTPVRISKPEYSWERAGIPVNEAPAVIKKSGKIFLAYSAANTGANYCMGLLTSSENSNLLNESSWNKSATPVMTSNTTTGQYGPGHNTFVKSEDGLTDILVYHARPYKDITGDPLYDPNRHTIIQKLYWNYDGTPNFGIPIANGALPRRYESYSNRSRYINHYNYIGNIEVTKAGLLADSQFNKLPGLANSNAISLESINFPGYYLKNTNNQLKLEKYDGSEDFKKNATFYQRAGLADNKNTTFESFTAPENYIKSSNNKLIVGPAKTELEKAEATFIED